MRKLLCLVLLSASLSLPLRAQSLNLNGTFWKQLWLR
jgi:hypothetical protein